MQAQESIKKDPTKAAIYSAILPGSGQIYTKKYWKIPVIYTGLITSGYYIKQSHSRYIQYKDAYILRTDNNTNTIDDFNTIYSNEQLVTLTEHYRRNLEISYLLCALTYILNIIDASVNAHLFEYNIDQNISMILQPTYVSKENPIFLSLSIKL